MVNYKFPDAATKSQSAQSSSQSNSAFEMLFSEAGRRQSFDPAIENQSRSRDDNRASQDRSRTDEARRDEQSARRRRENSRAEETSSAGAAVVQDTSAAHEAKNSNEPVAINEEDVITKVAEIMEVSEEVVEEWLQEMGLTASDLTDVQAVAKMLQAALDAESTAELLTNEKFPALYNSINDAMAEAKENQESLNALVEDLEATIEDGKVVVTNSNANRNSADNAGQQSATTETEQEVEQTNELISEPTDVKLLAPEEAINNESINPAVSMEAVTARTEQTVKQAAPQQPVDTANVIEQIMNQVKIASGGGQFNEIRMTLRPETLGDIVLRVITQNGIVMAQFEAESQRVKEALEADFNLLRNALEQQGIKFSELSVSVRQDENERMNQFERARQRSRHRAESIKGVSEAEEAKEISYHNGVIDVTA